jgi:hypothetical protein
LLLAEQAVVVFLLLQLQEAQVAQSLPFRNRRFLLAIQVELAAPQITLLAEMDQTASPS